MHTIKSKNIAVVGAGISGLTAAYYLKKFGYAVTVYEASHRVGGRMTKGDNQHAICSF